MWEEIDVRVAVSGEHAYFSVFSNHAVSDRETFLLFGNVAESVCCGRIEEFRDMRS